MPRPPHEHPLYRISSIGRPLDPRFATNKAISIIAALALAAGTAYDTIVHGLGWHVLATGASAMMTAFLSWALGRELDPDHDATAFIALVLAAGAWVVTDGGDLWPLLAALGMVRIVNRTVGPPAKITDGLMVVVLVAVAVFVSHRWSLAVVGAMAFALDGVLPRGRPRAWVFAGTCAALGVIAWQLGLVHPVMPRQPGLVGGIAGAYLLVATTLPPLRSPCDIPRFTLDHARVQAGMLLAAVVVLVAQVEGGRSSPAATLLAVLAAVVLGRLLSLVSGKRP